jgi:hypothetical protein
MSGRRDATEPEALALLDELGTVTAALEENAAAGDEIMRRRNELFVQLKALDVTNREIAARSKLTEMAVKKAIDKQRTSATV